MSKLGTNNLSGDKLGIEELKLPSNKQYRDDLIRLLNRESGLFLRRIADGLRINREVVRKAVLVMSKEERNRFAMA